MLTRRHPLDPSALLWAKSNPLGQGYSDSGILEGVIFSLCMSMLSMCFIYSVLKVSLIIYLHSSIFLDSGQLTRANRKRQRLTMRINTGLFRMRTPVETLLNGIGKQTGNRECFVWHVHAICVSDDMVHAWSKEVGRVAVFCTAQCTEMSWGSLYLNGVWALGQLIFSCLQPWMDLGEILFAQASYA